MEPNQNEPTNSVFSDSAKRQLEPRRQYWLFSALTFASILLIALAAFIITANVAKDSTPEDSLYKFKTEVVEKVIGATKFSDSAKLGYSNSLLEKRVAELLTLYSDQATTTDEVAGKLAELTKQHTESSVNIITKSSSLTAQEKILALAKITNSTRAFETLADTAEEFASIKDLSGDIQNISQEGLGQEIENFATTSDPTIVATFVGEQIAAVGEEIKTVANGSRAQKLALTKIDDAGESISDTKFAEAINYLLRARQAIAVDNYLYASERSGEIEPNLEAMPEGS